MSDWGRVRFRAWLVRKVLENANLSKVCCVAVHEKRIDEVAAQAGLHPSLVEDVGIEYARRVTAMGRPVPTGQKHEAAVYPQLAVAMPAVIDAAWRALSERLHVTPTMAIRSLVHWYLLGGDEPRHQDTRWVLRGQVVSGPPTKRWEPGMTHGALAALETRAERLGMTTGMLARCLVVDALANRRPVGTPIRRAAMYDDPKRYRL